MGFMLGTNNMQRLLFMWPRFPAFLADEHRALTQVMSLYFTETRLCEIPTGSN